MTCYHSFVTAVSTFTLSVTHLLEKDNETLLTISCSAGLCSLILYSKTSVNNCCVEKDLSVPYCRDKHNQCFIKQQHFCLSSKYFEIQVKPKILRCFLRIVQHLQWYFVACCIAKPFCYFTTLKQKVLTKCFQYQGK